VIETAHSIRLTALLLIAGALTLVGCARGTSPEAGSTVEPTLTVTDPAAPPSKPVNCKDVDLSQADWMLYCSEGDGMSTPKRRISASKPFNYLQTFEAGGEPVQWLVKVDELSCGIKTIQNAVDNPKWDGGDTYPQYIDATAPKGKQFCQLTATLKNTGKTPASAPIDFDDIVTTAGQFTQTDADNSITYILQDRTGTTPVNPGDTTIYVKVWTVPTGAKPTGVLFPSATVFSGPVYEVVVN
jgi:hypothetical protein